jgi:hypothetical protein
MRKYLEDLKIFCGILVISIFIEYFIYYIFGIDITSIQKNNTLFGVLINCGIVLMSYKIYIHTEIVIDAKNYLIGIKLIK